MVNIGITHRSLSLRGCWEGPRAGLWAPYTAPTEPFPSLAPLKSRSFSINHMPLLCSQTWNMLPPEPKEAYQRLCLPLTGGRHEMWPFVLYFEGKMRALQKRERESRGKRKENLKSRILGNMQAGGIVMSTGGRAHLGRRECSSLEAVRPEEHRKWRHTFVAGERKVPERTYISLVLFLPPPLASTSHEVGVELWSAGKEDRVENI